MTRRNTRCSTGSSADASRGASAGASSAAGRPAQIAASAAQWNRLMGVLDGQLARTAAHVAGEAFTLADIVLGLSTQRWLMTPIDRPVLPHVAAWRERLRQRPAFRRWGDNGEP